LREFDQFEQFEYDVYYDDGRGIGDDGGRGQERHVNGYGFAFGCDGGGHVLRRYDFAGYRNAELGDGDAEHFVQQLRDAHHHGYVWRIDDVCDEHFQLDHDYGQFVEFDRYDDNAGCVHDHAVARRDGDTDGYGFSLGCDGDGDFL
jgi:hypothetical protein